MCRSKICTNFFFFFEHYYNKTEFPYQPFKGWNKWEHTYNNHINLPKRKKTGQYNFTYTHHHSSSQGFFDSSGSRWLVSSLDDEISLFPDSNWDRDASSGLCFSSRLKRLDFFSSNGDWLLEESVKLWTCCRQTWTASCTRTKNQSLPIRSTTPDFVRVSRTSRFGLETAIWKEKNKSFE